MLSVRPMTKRMWAIWLCPEHDWFPIGVRLDEIAPTCGLCISGQEPPMERVIVEEVEE